MSQAVMEWDLKELSKIQTALSKVGDHNFKPMMTSLAMEIEEQTRERFQTKEGPNGPWEEWSESYKEQLQRKGKTGNSILQLDNRLEESITHTFQGSNLYNSRVQVGTPLIYSASHQYGDEERGIPERAYLGITPENESDLVDIINDHLEGLF